MNAAPGDDPAQAVLRIAARLLDDPCQLLDWYHGDGIAGLGDRTAAQLVAAGRAAEVIAFLHGVLAAENGVAGVD